MITLSVDAMSGDAGPQQCVPGAMLAVAADPDLRVLLVGQPEVLPALVDAAVASQRDAAALRSRVDIVAAPEVVGMDESARDAIRRRKHSSMRIAVDLVHQGLSLIHI